GNAGDPRTDIASNAGRGAGFAGDAKAAGDAFDPRARTDGRAAGPLGRGAGVGGEAIDPPAGRHGRAADALGRGAGGGGSAGIGVSAQGARTTAGVRGPRGPE